MPFLFESLDVYKKTMEFLAKVNLLSKNIKDKENKDQLKRAALSIALNLAEGNGRNTPKKKFNFLKWLEVHYLNASLFCKYVTN